MAKSNEAADLTPETRRRGIMHSTYLSMAFNIAIAALQLVVAPLTNSQALLAHGIHSVSDVISDILVLLTGGHGTRPADDNHPYGHARLETLGVLILGVMLMVVGIFFLIKAGKTLMSDDILPVIGWGAAVAAAITAIGKEGVFQYLKRAAVDFNSPLILANAWHSRADAASAMVVLIGIIGGVLGWPFLDTLAAFIMGMMILRMGWKMAYKSLAEMVDTGATPDFTQRLREIVEATPGVRGLHEVRTRRMANRVLVDAHVVVDSHISVSEAHLIGEHARARLKRNNPEVMDFLVHLDAEEDDDTRPLTPQVREVVARELSVNLASPLPHFNLHYLNQNIEVELIYAVGATPDEPARLRHFSEVIKNTLPQVTCIYYYQTQII